MHVVLHGYKYSVYAWIARLALAEKGVAYAWQEANPFSPDLPDDYTRLHPFKRVPVLVADDLTIYETSAITRFIDEAFPGPRLQPASAIARARVNQIIAVVDNYGYWPLVRQVFAHGVMAARMNRPSDPAEVERGLQASPRVLQALEGLAGDGKSLVEDAISLADVHVAPMLDYFLMHEAGAGQLEACPRLERWWSRMQQSSSLTATRPVLP